MLGVIGDIVQDIVVWQLEPVRGATDTKAEIHVARGGSAANVAAFAGPRTPTRFIGCVGDDLAGLAVTRDLEARGVEVRNQVSSLATGMIVLQIDETGERDMFPSRAACADLGPVDPQWLDDIEILHLTAYSFESGRTPGSVVEAAQAVRDRGGRISLDVSSVYTMDGLGRDFMWSMLEELRPAYISANRDEALWLGLADGQTPGPELSRLEGAQLMGRNGKDETNVFRGGELIEVVPVEPATAIRDLTGAGDAFNAGFLVSVLNDGEDPRVNVLAGHALARRVLASPGASEPPMTADTPAN